MKKILPIIVLIMFPALVLAMENLKETERFKIFKLTEKRGDIEVIESLKNLEKFLKDFVIWTENLHSEEVKRLNRLLKITVDIDGNVGIGTTSTAKLDINSDILRLRTPKTPANAYDTGNTGDICWDSSYVYVCVDTNTWERAALSTWAVTDVLLLDDGTSKLLLDDGTSNLLIRP